MQITVGQVFCEYLEEALFWNGSCNFSWRKRN
jgi:hypothetical protein